MERENFFVLLGLSFDPPPQDPAEIKSAIQQKYREWSRLYDDPRNSSTALQYMEMVPEIEAVLLDPEKRLIEAEKAVELRQQLLSPFQAEALLLEGKGYVHPREVKSLEDKYGRYGITPEYIRAHINLPITDTPPKKMALKHDNYALDRDLALEIQRHLDVLGVKNLYAFLRLPPTTQTGVLLTSAQNRQHEAFHSTGKTGTTTAVQHLSELAMVIFETKETKKSYDLYLSISKYPELDALIHEEYIKSEFISPEILMRLVNFGVSSFGTSVLETEEYVRQYCIAYQITVDIAPPQTVCPNCEGKSPRGTAYCQHCAAPLEGNCPNCNTFFSDGASICANCSFPIGNMGKALPYVDQAETALIENNWSGAQHAIKYIIQYWPTHPKLERLRERCNLVEERYVSTIKAIETAMNHNRYYAAKELARDAKEKQITLPTDMLQSIRGTITEFENKLSEIRLLGDSSFDALNILAGHVSDSLELGRMLSKYPPEIPMRFTARPSGETVQLNWGQSPSLGRIKYIIVRKENSVPLTAYDGEVLYEGTENSFEDGKIPPLKNFFYSVFVERGGSFSEIGAVAAAPVRIIPELKDLSVTPADKAARLTWTPVSALRQTKIWRKTGGDPPNGPGVGKEIENTRLEGYSDIGLENDVEYWYYMVAVYYTDEGETIQSQGVIKSVTPHKLVSPIDHYTIAKSDEMPNTYLVNWEGAPRDDVMFLHSQFRPTHHVGQMVETPQLLLNYNRLPLEKQTTTSAQFQFRFNGGTYVFPVVVSGKFGSVGSVQYLTNVPEVDNLTYDIVESDLYINFRWPSAILPSVTVAYRKDSFPVSFDQKGTTIVECTREEYDMNAGVKIPDTTTGIYYFTIYSTFVSPEKKKIHSKGENLLVDNSPAKEFYYDLKYSKPLFSSHYLVKVTMQGSENFQLPRGLLVGKVGRIPLSITDGDPLFEIQKEQEISGSITYEYPSEKLPKDLYVRLFFFQPQDYQRLRPIPGQSLRLT